MHTPRRRGVKAEPRILYWFRTPPGVRVGRSALDEDAIRMLEEHNPDVHFDWTRMLKQPQQTAMPEPRSAQLPQRRRGQRPGGRPEGPPRGAAAPPAPAPFDSEARADAPEPFESTEESSESMTEPFEPVAEPFAAEPLEAEAESFEPLAEPLESPDAAPVQETNDDVELTEDVPVATELDALSDEDEAQAAAESAVYGVESAGRPTAAEARLGPEALARLRGRYAEILARIAERGGDEPAKAELKERAERLNPDAWVTDDEVREALEQYEMVFESLRAVIGQRRRRRRRRKDNA